MSLSDLGLDELVVLRLAMLAVLFLFLLAIGLLLSGGLRPRSLGTTARGAEAAALPALVIVAPGATGLRPGEAFVVPPEVEIGRGGTAGIVLSDPSVSVRHARVARAAGGWRVTDLGSTNGTRVDGRPVDERGAQLRGGEEVAFGVVVLRFER